MSITWNEISSDSIGVTVERVPTRYIPTRKFNPISIAGRNGDVLITDESFPNVTQRYEVYLSEDASDLPTLTTACSGWLCAPTGYARLEDSFDSTVYREAYLSEGFDVENMLNQFGRATIAFSCKPQKWLVSGQTATSETTITNPTPFIAKPLLTVSGSGTISFNGNTITVLEDVTDFSIDCYTMNADDNTQIYTLDFPYLVSGENTITLSDGITAFSIVPRWWTL